MKTKLDIITLNSAISGVKIRVNISTITYYQKCAGNTIGGTLMGLSGRKYAIQVVETPEEIDEMLRKGELNEN
jgi:hypothetical protein